MIELIVDSDFHKLSVHWCNCEDLPHVLVTHGLFPTAPSYPRMAISVHLLDFYRALFERSCDAVNAMARALNTFYARRGYIITDKKVRFYFSNTVTAITQEHIGCTHSGCVSSRARLRSTVVQQSTNTH